MVMNNDENKFAKLRRRALEFPTEQPVNSTPISEEVQRLIQELDTYQIELELQILDLRQVQEDLEKSYRRYADLYDFAPVAYFTVSVAGMITEANLTAAEKLGVARTSAVKASKLPIEQQLLFGWQPLLSSTRKAPWEPICAGNDPVLEHPKR